MENSVEYAEDRKTAPQQLIWPSDVSHLGIVNTVDIPITLGNNSWKAMMLKENARDGWSVWYVECVRGLLV